MKSIARVFIFFVVLGSCTLSLTSLSRAETAESEISPIVVSSELERSGLPLGFQPGSFVKKSQDDVSSAISRSLRDVTSDVPGVAFLGGPRTRAELPQIRGLGSDRVLILEDGARQNFQSGHSGRVFSDIGGFEEVEIVKGPLSSMFGSGAIGGVVNLRRPGARDLMKRSGRNQGGEISIDTSTADSGLGQRYSLFSVIGDSKLDSTSEALTIEPLISYSQAKSKDIIQSSGRKLPYSAHETKEIYGNLASQIGSWRADLKVTNYEDAGIAPFNPAEDTSVLTSIAETKNVKTDTVLAVTKNKDKKESAWSLSLKPFVRKSRVERARITDRRGDLLAVETVGVDAHADFSTGLSRVGRSVIGFEGFRDLNRGERNGATYGLFPNGDTTQAGLYAQVPVDISSKISATSGVRFDQYKSTPSDQTLRGNEGSAISPKLYLVWDLDGVNNVFLGWGRGFNAPRLQDLYVSGLHFPGQAPAFPNNFFQSNPDLRPETTDSFETGYRGKNDLWNYNVTGFFTEAQDFIQRDVNLAAGTTRLANIDRATLYGLELLVKRSFGSWSATLTAASVRGVNRRTSEPLADTPADRASLVIDHAISDSWTLSGDAELVLGQERVPDGVSSTGGYTLFNLGSGYAINQDVIVTLKATNLLNRSYRRHGSQVDDAGQDIRAAVTARF